MRTWIRFERGRDAMVGPTLGPFNFVQITYDLIRDDKGNTLAMYADGDWELMVDDHSDNGIFSDAIIYHAEKAE